MEKLILEVFEIFQETFIMDRYQSGKEMAKESKSFLLGINMKGNG